MTRPAGSRAFPSRIGRWIELKQRSRAECRRGSCRGVRPLPDDFRRYDGPRPIEGGPGKTASFLLLFRKLTPKQWKTQNLDGVFFIVHRLHTGTQLIGRYMLKETWAGSSASSSIVLVFGPQMGGAVIPLAGRPFVGQVLSGIAVTNLSNARIRDFLFSEGIHVGRCVSRRRRPGKRWQINCSACEARRSVRSQGQEACCPGTLLPRSRTGPRSLPGGSEDRRDLRIGFMAPAGPPEGGASRRWPRR